jgi:hypothetical protein
MAEINIITEYNIKIDLREIRWCGMEYINVTKDRDKHSAPL